MLAGAAERVASRVRPSCPRSFRWRARVVVTDLPLRAAPALLELAEQVDLGKPRSIVLEPPRWTRQLPGSYAIAPRVLEVQKLFDRLFGAG